jgi:probable F420-dependent oxidoreductase
VLLDAALGADPAGTAGAATALESDGFAGLWVGETKQDPFLQSLQALQATEHVTVGTSVAIAFARTPMLLAVTGYDLARAGSGRFVLGLGSQIKAHVERRFSMPWSHPAARMRELVLAMRAIWSCWQDGTPLRFEGEFYRHTLMTPFFSPDPHPWGPPPVYLAGVGALMTEVAGEVGDGYFFHAFTTERYMRETTVPALRRGRAKGGREGLAGFTVCAPAFVTVGRTEAELAAAEIGTKEQIAFYASTPAYRGVLDSHGWADLQPELAALSKAGRWADMARLVDDDMLRAFSVVGTPAEVAREVRVKYDGLADRLSFYGPYPGFDEVLPELLAAVRA